MKKLAITFAFNFLACTTHLASADGRYETAIAGIVKSDDGFYNLLILYPDIPAFQEFCGKDWSYGVIQSKIKSSIHSGARVSLPGCWIVDTAEIEKATIEFKYLNPSTHGVRGFTAKASNFKKYTFDQEEEQLMPFIQR